MITRRSLLTAGLAATALPTASRGAKSVSAATLKLDVDTSAATDQIDRLCEQIKEAQELGKLSL